MRVLIAILALTLPMAAANVEGGWKGFSTTTSKYGNVVKVQMNLNLLQYGTKVTGSLQNAKGTYPVLNGSESNGTVTLVIKGKVGQATFRLTAAGNQMTGTGVDASGTRVNVQFTKN